MLPELQALDTLLSSITWRERFIVTCVGNHPLRSFVQHWSADNLHGLRWQVVSGFCCEILPLEKMLRECWNLDKFMKGELIAKNHTEPSVMTRRGKKKINDCVPAKDFVAEETSRVTLKHITELMSCNYKWASIALVAQLSTESELVANWSEGCSCKDHYGQCFLSEPTGEGSPCCPFKGCRAPELACGVALALQTCKVRSNRAVFNEYVSKAPEAKRSELYNTWSKGSGKIWGASVWTRIVLL